ncbi:hypothetical protein BAC3_01354 [uncultured bacterium]|nr:hypothetical protein BAC3_01354 [uncultured bacterium]
METDKHTVMIDRRRGRVIAADIVDQWRDDSRMRLLTVTSVMVDSLMDYCEMLYEIAYRAGYEAAANPTYVNHLDPGEPSE